MLHLNSSLGLFYLATTTHATCERTTGVVTSSPIWGTRQEWERTLLTGTTETIWGFEQGNPVIWKSCEVLNQKYLIL